MDVPQKLSHLKGHPESPFSKVGLKWFKWDEKYGLTVKGAVTFDLRII